MMLPAALVFYGIIWIIAYLMIWMIRLAWLLLLDLINNINKIRKDKNAADK